MLKASLTTNDEAYDRGPLSDLCIGGLPPHFHHGLLESRAAGVPYWRSARIRPRRDLPPLGLLGRPPQPNPRS